MLTYRTKEHAGGAWWLIVFVGVAGMIFGSFAMFWPGIELIILIHMLAVFAIVVGMVSVIQSLVDAPEDKLWWLSLAFGILCIVASVSLLLNSQLSLTIFIIFLLTFLFVKAIMDFVAAAHAERGQWLWFSAGVIGVVFACMILAYPNAGGALAFTWVLGLYAFLQGILTEVYAYKLDQRAKALEKRRRRRGIRNTSS